VEMFFKVGSVVTSFSCGFGPINANWPPGRAWGPCRFDWLGSICLPKCPVTRSTSFKNRGGLK
jgi:hypothetical protein